MKYPLTVAFQKLARLEEIPPGQTRYFPRPGGPILLAHFEGSIYAVSGICPHQLNPLEGAALVGPFIDCPWHHFQFDCRSGANCFPTNAYPVDLQDFRRQLISLRSYPVEMRDGDVWVDLP